MGGTRKDIMHILTWDSAQKLRTQKSVSKHCTYFFSVKWIKLFDFRMIKSRKIKYGKIDFLIRFRIFRVILDQTIKDGSF